MKWPSIEEKLEKHGLTVFTSLEFRRATGLTPTSAKFILIRYVKRGLVLRLKENRGLYCLKKKPPHPWFLANKLLQPSYVSLESALSHHGIIPESTHAVTSVTPLTTRTFTSMGLRFTYQKIKTSAFGAYVPIELGGETIFMASLEKAMADFLYFIHRRNKPLNDRIRWSRLKREKVLSCLRMFRSESLVHWAQNVIPKHH